LLTRGHAAGAWNGTNVGGAFNSSVAAGSAASDGVGYGLGSQIKPATIGPFNIAPGDALLRYTLDGDADLDTDVDLDDVGKWSVNFTGELGGSGTKSWTQGDWDFDGDADLDDVGKWSINFTGELGGGTGAATVAPLAVSAAQNPPATRSSGLARFAKFAGRIISSMLS
jgi:hypothetical protein